MKTRVLLTAAVQPQSDFRLYITDPDTRRRQYITAVQKWAAWAEGSGARLTFMENSGHDLEQFARDAGLPRAVAIDWVNAPTPPESVSSRGKGASEALMMDEFAARYANDDDDLWLKGTGRLSVRNLRSALPSSVGEGFLARLSIAMDHVDTRVIGATPTTWARYFLMMSNHIDEANEIRIEHVAARRILLGLSEGVTLNRFVRQPAFDGVSGTWEGRSYRSPSAAAKRVVAERVEQMLRTTLKNKHF